MLRQLTDTAAVRLFNYNRFARGRQTQDRDAPTTSRVVARGWIQDIRNLLRSAPIQFVVVNVGVAPRWIPLKECFVFWKSEVQPHLPGETRAILDQFPGEYCYFASLWDGGDAATPLVVLEKAH